jgi:general stress protein 26
MITRAMSSERMSLDDKDMERRIAGFMKTQGMCVLATCSGGEPRASAVEFFPEGTTIYILTEGGRKIENIEKNPRVSVAIHTQFTGWDSIKGIQITGKAEVGASGSKVFDEGVEAYRRRRGLKSVSVPSFMHIVKVTPRKIEYLDTTLKAKGLDTKHVLEY